MILYRPTDGDVHANPLEFKPRTCFVMAQLGGSIPPELREARKAFAEILPTYKYRQVDADGVTTGRDFLLKIWSLALAVPVGIAFIHRNISACTMANIFYELGCMQAYGKETLIVRIGGAEIPSDFVRTEYVDFDGHFERKVRGFLSALQERADYYVILAKQLERNPLLAIDYVRRAYLLTGDQNLRRVARRLFNEAGLGERANNSVEQLLISFCQPKRSRKRPA